MNQHNSKHLRERKFRPALRVVMLLVIDNYDSFTYNLVQYLGETGTAMSVVLNDEMPVERIEEEMRPTRILISPGPGTPSRAGISPRVVQRFAGRVPILGVCLGHQVIAEHYGARVSRAPIPVHGKPAQVRSDGKTIFAGIPRNFRAGRYHSLIVRREGLPEVLEVSAETDDGIIMCLRHRRLPIEGVQFHPESIMTEHGRRMLRNFLEL